MSVVVEKSHLDWIIGWIAENQHTEDSNIQRFRDNNELFFCLRSIHRFAPYIRTIHIILGRDSSPPEWLTNHPKINLIKESSLYSPVQPNSETKKLYYHKIPGIANYFMTSDDDMFLVNTLVKSDCFSNNIPILNSVGYCIARKGVAFVDDKGHIPLIWKKTHYELAVNHLNKSLFQNAGKKRYNPWIEMKRFLLSRNYVLKGNVKCPGVLINDTNVINIESVFNDFLSRYFFGKLSNKFMCINDDFDRTSGINYQKQYLYLRSFLAILFKEKAPWEVGEIPNKFKFIEQSDMKHTFTIEKNFGKSDLNTKIITMNYSFPPNVKVSFKTKPNKTTNEFSYQLRDKQISIKRIDTATGWNFNHSFIMVLSL